jgi:hypothetical protein
MGDPEPSHRATVAFTAIEARHAPDVGVRRGMSWGSTPDLRVNGRIYAMLCRGELVVKLPAGDVDEIVDGGGGRRFDPWRNGRLMKEWVTIPDAAADVWPIRADAALAYVRAITAASG